jgi:hypothetical protein
MSTVPPLTPAAVAAVATAVPQAEEPEYNAETRIMRQTWWNDVGRVHWQAVTEVEVVVVNAVFEMQGEGSRRMLEGSAVVEIV